MDIKAKLVTKDFSEKQITVCTDNIWKTPKPN